MGGGPGDGGAGVLGDSPDAGSRWERGVDGAVL